MENLNSNTVKVGDKLLTKATEFTVIKVIPTGVWTHITNHTSRIGAPGEFFIPMSEINKCYIHVPQ